MLNPTTRISDLLKPHSKRRLKGTLFYPLASSSSCADPEASSFIVARLASAHAVISVNLFISGRRACGIGSVADGAFLVRVDKFSAVPDVLAFLLLRRPVCGAGRAMVLVICDVVSLRGRPRPRLAGRCSEPLGVVIGVH
jgi:hypothetical protein